MPSPTYKLFREAIFTERQVHCAYDGYPRELCPVILGYSDGDEKVLAYQVGGTSSKGLSREGEWKCLRVTKIRNPTMRDGLWREGEQHGQMQSCIREVDVDINIHVRKRR
jgi:hypothetical protein